MKIKKLVVRYLAWCADHHRPNTVKYYRCRLKNFVMKFGKRKFESLSLIEIEEHLARVGQGQSSNTRRGNVVAFLRLQSWALEHEFIAVAVAPKLKKPKARRREKIPSRKETAIILLRGSRPFRLIYQALRYSGARPGELCGAKISDIKEGGTVIELWDHKTAGKTGRPRRILIGRKLGKILAWSIGDRTEGPIFLSPRGRSWTVGNLSATYRNLRNGLDLPKHLVVYLARHEFGTRATEKCGIHPTMTMMGHTQITTTQQYVHPDENILREQQDKVF